MSQPFVSVITPTYNRHAFLPVLIRQFQLQTYHHAKMELVILDDSAAPSEFAEAAQQQDPRVRYVYVGPERVTLGKKRNMLHGLARGDVIVPFDDDDVHMPERVRHSVHKLTTHNGDLAGSSMLLVCDGASGRVFREGPYHDNHGTAGTMAYTRKYIEAHAFDDDARFAEEGNFTGHYTAPMVQLDPYKCIVCIAHAQNTVDKRFTFRPERCLPQPLKDLIKDPVVRAFFTGSDRPACAAWDVAFLVAVPLSDSKPLAVWRSLLASLLHQAGSVPFKILLTVSHASLDTLQRLLEVEFPGSAVVVEPVPAHHAGCASRALELALDAIHERDGDDDVWLMLLSDVFPSVPDTLLLEHANNILAHAKARHGAYCVSCTQATRSVAVACLAYGLAVHPSVFGGRADNAFAEYKEWAFRQGLPPDHPLTSDVVISMYCSQHGAEPKVLEALRLGKDSYGFQLDAVVMKRCYIECVLCLLGRAQLS